MDRGGGIAWDIAVASDFDCVWRYIAATFGFLLVVRSGKGGEKRERSFRPCSNVFVRTLET